MKTLGSITLSLLLIFISLTVKATTWDEPWIDKVIRDADGFIFAKILNNDEKKGVEIEIIKTIGGTSVTGKINITSFYDLHLCSMSAGEGPEFHFAKGDSCYYFIKKAENGNYAIATPTTGFARYKNSIVAATYRHSYHQAMISADVYEMSMKAIFNNYHHQAYDKNAIESYVNQYLSKKPAGLIREELDLFFHQHVALECVYHLKLAGHFNQLVPFVKDTTNFHAEISAIRALSVYNTPASKAELMKILTDPKQNGFIKVITVWSLTAFKPVELKPRLIELEKTASTEENGFGGNIMDPRVCTHFPTVKDAISILVKTL